MVFSGAFFFLLIFVVSKKSHLSSMMIYVTPAKEIPADSVFPRET